MPQKHPPATTAVCSPLLVAMSASTAGFGKAVIALSAALQLTTAKRVTIKSRIEMREKLPMTNSFSVPGQQMGLVWLESATSQKFRHFQLDPPVTLILVAHLMVRVT